MSETGEMAIFSGTPGVMPKRSPTGVYDDGILCPKCEEMLGPWDQYGIEFTRRPVTMFNSTMPPGTTRVIQTHEVNYTRLKLFVLSVLWRAHWASHELFSNVRLGPFEETLRTQLRARDPGTARDFAVFITRYEGGPGAFLASPHQSRIGGMRVYVVHFALHDFCIVVDRRNATFPSFDEFVLAPDAPLRMVCSPLLGGVKSKYVYGMADKLRQAEDSWPRLPKYLSAIRQPVRE